MKTEQKTSSGNRAQTPLSELIYGYSQKQPGNRKETMREQSESIPTTL